MTGWAVMLRGMRHRAGRSALVALLAAVAVAAAVLAPGFSRAAEQSVLTDGLTEAGRATALTVTATGTAEMAPAAHQVSGDARIAVDGVLARHPTLARALDDPIAGVDTDTLVRGDRDPVAARLAYRDGVCDHLTITGECPIDAGRVLISARTSADHGIGVGDLLTVRFADHTRELEVAGMYQPPEVEVPYWGGTAYFTHGGFDPESGAPRVDAMFTVAQSDVQADPDAVVNLSLSYPLPPPAVRLDDVPTLRDDLAAAGTGIRAAGLEPATALPTVLDQVAADRDAIARTAPVIAVPLLVLAWVVLFLLVGAVTEERGREIALAKLRGFPAGRAARFGIGEVLVLIVAAAAPGIALGLGVVEAAGRLALADGAHVEVRAPVFAAAGVALAGAVVAAVLAGRATLRRSALVLLRRVPARGGWRAGAAEGMLVALAAAALVVTLGDRTAPLAMLTPALLAVVAGVAAARLVGLWSRLRLRVARRRGRIPGLLSAAQLARRPEGRRLVAVVAVAVALLTFTATAWDVAAQARHDHAVATVGADRVYRVSADHPAALLAAARTAAPDGRAMAVARTSVPYAGQQVELLGVDSPRLATVARWPDGDPPGGTLRPPVPERMTVAERVEVTASTVDPGPQEVRLSALVAAPGQPPDTVELGTLRESERTYAAALPACPAGGCRLLGLSLGRTGVAGPFTATVTVEWISSAGGELAAGFDDPGVWRVVEPGRANAPAVELTHGNTLTVAVDGGQDGDVVLAHRDSVDVLPVVLAGAAPADDPAADEFTFPGFSQRAEPFTVAGTADSLPRVGDRGLMFDLEYASAAAGRTVGLADSTLTYEVWADRSAPADLPQRLAAAGVPVVDADTLTGTVDRLARRAPALGLWLHLLAAGMAVALASGVVALAGRIGLDSRRYEWAALRVGGVRTGTLRRALLREQAALVGWPLLIGAVAGVAAAALMLPGLPLVETGTPTGTSSYRLQPGAIPVAAAVTATALLVIAALRALRLPRRAGPELVREGWQ